MRFQQTEIYPAHARKCSRIATSLSSTAKYKHNLTWESHRIELMKSKVYRRKRVLRSKFSFALSLYLCLCRSVFWMFDNATHLYVNLMSILCVLLLCFRVLELNRCVCCCCCFFSYSFHLHRDMCFFLFLSFVLSRWLLPSFCFRNFCLFRPRFGKIQLNWHRARTPFFSFFLRFVAAAVVTMCDGCRYCRWCRCRSLVFLFVRSSSSSFWSHLGVDFKRTHTHTLGV